eukprot:11463465-Heterocapsa_arctica.AAC.1
MQWSGSEDPTEGHSVGDVHHRERCYGREEPLAHNAEAEPDHQKEANEDGGRSKHHPLRAPRARRGGPFTCLVKGASKGEA